VLAIEKNTELKRGRALVCLHELIKRFGMGQEAATVLAVVHEIPL
jgi:hypothetical protein